jgi:uncharacterized protein DUF4326
MKGLTLMQPWDYAHVHLGKRVENRTWRIPRDRYALHTGQSRDMHGADFIEALTGQQIDWSKIVPSAIFAVCDIIQIVEIDPTERPEQMSIQLRLDLRAADPDMQIIGPLRSGHAKIVPEQRKWAFGPWAHVYEEKTFRILPKPVPCKGHQGLWELPAPVWTAVFEQMRWMPPVVLNRHVHGKPQGSVYIGRPSKWGNPFGWTWTPSTQYVVPKEEVLQRYEDWLLDRKQAHLVADARRELCGRDLVCSCAPRPCHGDPLIRIANAA